MVIWSSVAPLIPASFMPVACFYSLTVLQSNIQDVGPDPLNFWGEKQENYFFSNLQSVRLMHTFELMLGTHPSAVESVSKGGKTTALGQAWQQIQEQWKPEEATLTPSHKGVCLSESFAFTQQWGDAGH